MAASAIQNPASRSESKSSKKKKAPKAGDSTVVTSTSPAPIAAPASTGAVESNNGDGSYESPYIKELYKSIRNVNKKITNASKVDNILAENPDLTLDALVAARKINADQKAQILKKPQLQASLTQLEEQIAQYKKFDQEYKAKSQAEKAEFEKTLTTKSQKELEDALAATKAEARAAAAKEQQDNFLLLSQFLRLAAARRAEEADSTLDENMALEGVLLSVYSGDESAVATIIKLINGVEENTTAVTGEQLSTTYAQVKAASLAHAPPLGFSNESTDETYSSPAVETTEYPVQGDPTLINAGLTELDAPPATVTTNGHEQPTAESTNGVPQNSGIDEGAANAAAESHWDTGNDLSTSQEWVNVNVPRDTSETDTGLLATPAAPSNTQSWADEQPDSPKAEVSAPPNDGFHEVHRNRGGNRDGQFRGRGRGGDGGYRGRGSFRGGEGGYRGRGGRGGPRGGGQGAPRGRRPDDA